MRNKHSILTNGVNLRTLEYERNKIGRISNDNDTTYEHYEQTNEMDEKFMEKNNLFVTILTKDSKEYLSQIHI